MCISERLYQKMGQELERSIRTGKVQEPDAASPPETDGRAALNIVLWGDPQISCLSPLRSARVYSACEDIKNSRSRYDALVLLGDVTEYGTACEYRFVQKLLAPIAGKFRHIFAVPGNHDIRFRPYKKQVERFSAFLRGLENGRTGGNGRYYFAETVNGYRFLLLGADRAAFEGSYLSREQLNWVDKELAAQQGSGKPVFVFNHQPLKRTNGLPVTFLGRGKWRGSVGNESDRLLEIFQKYENIIYITGHLHYCTSRYTYEDHGSFHAISVPTVGVINHGSFKKFTQGYVLSVDGDEITARSRIFGEGKYTDADIDNATIKIRLNNRSASAEAAQA